MINSNVSKHTIGWLYKQSKNGLLDFSISIQRKEVWDLEHKSNLISSILIGVPIESLLFEEAEDIKDGYLVLDGVQRSTTLIRYLNGEFAISEKTKITQLDDIELVGKYFNDLPEYLQDELKEYELSISIVRPLADEEREMLFFMRNQHVPLKKIELTRVLLGNKLMDVIAKLASHEFFTKTGLSASAINRYQDQQLVLECLILDSKKELGFSSKDVSIFAEELNKEGIAEDDVRRLTETFNYLNRAIPNRYTKLRKVHIPMMYKMAQKAIKEKVLPEKFYVWMTEFFKYIKENPDCAYNVAVTSRSAELSNVKKRISFIADYYEANIIREGI